MTQQGPDPAERNGAHDDQGLEVGPEGNGQQGVDGKQREQKADHEGALRLALLPLLPAEGKGGPRNLALNVGEHAGLEARFDRVAGRDARVHVGRHRDDSAAVLPVDLRGAVPERHVRDLLQGHLRPGGRPDAVVAQVLDGVALVVGQPGVDAHLVLSALEPVGLQPEEGGADLAGEVVEREAERPGARLHRQFQLPLALLLVGLDVEHAPEAGQGVLHGGHRPVELVGRGGRQLHRDGLAHRHDVGGERERARAGHPSGLRAPSLLKLRGRDVALLRVDHLEAHLGHVGLRGGEAARAGVAVGLGLAADGHVHVLDEVLPGLRFEGLDGLVPRLLQAGRHALGGLRRGAHRHLQLGRHQLSLHTGEEGESDVPVAGETEGDEQQRHARHEGHAVVPGGEPEGRRERAAHEGPELGGHPPPHPVERADRKIGGARLLVRSLR